MAATERTKYFTKCLCIAIILLISQVSIGQLSEKTKIQTLLNTPENKGVLNFVAVFVLTTLTDKFFTKRVEVSRLTWAHPVKHFYAVTGENSENRRFLNNKKRCHDHTDHYKKIMKHFATPTREEIYICDGIHVLHLPYCDSSYWGPMVRMYLRT